MTKPKWESEKLEDGRVRIHLDEGVSDALLLAALRIHQKAEDNIKTAFDLEQLRRRLEKMQVKEGELSELIEKASTRKVATPPLLAEVVISFLAPKNTVQSLLGDLHEMFQKNADQFGERQARRKFWLQVYSSIGPLLFQWLKRIGFFTILVDYFRSKFGL